MLQVRPTSRAVRSATDGAAIGPQSVPAATATTTVRPALLFDMMPALRHNMLKMSCYLLLIPLLYRIRYAFSAAVLMFVGLPA